MLVQALAAKQRTLVVLDDPWTPEQVRLLNPIDSSQTTEHRLLITTRIRDLLPKATQVELPLMGKDDAVALLLELAGIEEAGYLKEYPDSAWPPQAAFAISAECGLLPITLTIAAQAVRAWGSGYVGRSTRLIQSLTFSSFRRCHTHTQPPDGRQQCCRCCKSVAVAPRRWRSA